jgi:fructosamine-3-kinase
MPLMTRLSPHILLNIEQLITQHLTESTNIISSHSVRGGDINEAFRLATNNGSYFIKTNNAHRYPKMFESEAKGLELLRSTDAIKIPEVIAFGEVEEVSFLMLEWIESAPPEGNFWNNFGVQLANLHQNSNEYFGLDQSNYIGSLSQSNNQYQTWVEFFANERLEPQIKLAVDAGKMDSATIAQFQKLYKELSSIFPKEPPALLHGDLWSGNFMEGNKGEPVIMDPAVYYGHREMDLAMTKLFGGFNNKLYEAYHNQYPLDRGWESRVPICNLYLLLVHVNLFGGGYLNSVKRIISSF